jgi:hypothetical protein
MKFGTKVYIDCRKMQCKNVSQTKYILYLKGKLIGRNKNMATIRLSESCTVKQPGVMKAPVLGIFSISKLYIKDDVLSVPASLIFEDLSEE